MMQLWLRFTLVGVLALGAWISGMDANAAPIDAAWLWAASALLAAHAVHRYLLRPR